MKAENLEAIGKRQCCYQDKHDIGPCVQRVYDEKDKYCYYHRKLVDGLIEKLLPE